MRLLQRLIFDKYCEFSNLDAYAAGVASMVQRSFFWSIFSMVGCCFIGHRKIEATEELNKRLIETVKDLLGKGVRKFYIGTRAFDFDDMCYDVVTYFKTIYPDIVRVCLTTRHEWRGKTAETEPYAYDSDIMGQELTYDGYEITYTPDNLWDSGKASYVERNKMMIDDSEYCVFYYEEGYAPEKKQISKKGISGMYTSGHSGTKIAYDYAVKKGKKIINVYLSE